MEPIQATERCEGRCDVGCVVTFCLSHICTVANFYSTLRGRSPMQAFALAQIFAFASCCWLELHADFATKRPGMSLQSCPRTLPLTWAGLNFI